ncbi:MAG TPA: hypothetical protein VFI48_01735, partial [Hyphomicrobiaceae bacterium]|nr:hypothetical protein [Hyphomicrobiaceae bacterium]
ALIHQLRGPPYTPRASGKEADVGAVAGCHHGRSCGIAANGSSDARAPTFSATLIGHFGAHVPVAADTRSRSATPASPSGFGYEILLYEEGASRDDPQLAVTVAA